MFTLHIDNLSDMDWHIENGALVSRSGTFTPFSHPMVGVRAVSAPSGQLGIFIFERPNSDASPRIYLERSAEYNAIAELKKRAESWPLHWFFLVISSTQVDVFSSRLSTVPVFYTDKSYQLDMSWDPLLLFRFIHPVLDRQRAMLYLSHFEQPYGGNTLLAELKQCCSGYYACWQPGRGWETTLLVSRVHAYPKVLRDNVNPCDSFAGLLRATLQRLLPDSSQRVAVGFSGGLDSSIVAAIAAQCGYSVFTYGLLMPDAGRVYQEIRRHTVIEKYGLNDYTVDTRRGMPTGRYGRARHQPMVPWEELHYDYFDKIYQRAREDSCNVFLTGFGGDELLAEYWDEMPDGIAAAQTCYEEKILPDFLAEEVHQFQRERLDKLMVTPAIYAQCSVVEAIGGVAAQCLRNGLWPIHLFTTPEVVRYCHSLPHEWRVERTLMRTLLMDWGVGEVVAYPEKTEDFVILSRRALSSCQLAYGGFPLKRLEKVRLIDTGKISAAYRRWLAGKEPGEMDIYFIAAVALESMLESVENENKTTQ